MLSLLCARAKPAVLGLLMFAAFGVQSLPAQALSTFAPQAGEFSVAGALPGDQMHPSVAISSAGGYVVWQDNTTDGDGWGISAQRLNNNLSGSLSTFRVNSIGAGDQENPKVAMLQNGGAVFVWQGGLPSFQKIYARFLASNGTFATGDLMVNTYTNNQQINPAVAVLADGTVIVAWSSFEQDGSLQGIFAQRLSATGQKIGVEFQVNHLFTVLNQRNPVVTALGNGGFVVGFISEVVRGRDANGQTAYGSDFYARIYDASANPVAANEIRLDSANSLCAFPSMASTPTGGFTAVWGQKTPTALSNSWDVYARSFTANGTAVNSDYQVNTYTYGDQYAPQIQTLNNDHLIVWTSLGQDGSREGVFGQFVSPTGGFLGGEFQVNTTTFEQQMQPAVATDGSSRFLVTWTSYQFGTGTRFDLFGQRYATTQALPQLPAPFLTALSQNTIMVSWANLAGYNVASYGLYVDGSPTPITVTNNYFIVNNLLPGSTHQFQIDYLLTDSRRASPSAAASISTWGVDANFDGLPDDWQALYFGSNKSQWPSANTIINGATVLQYFLWGGDPTNPDSVLSTRMAKVGTQWQFQWNTQPGSIYQVQVSTDFKTWTNLGGARFAAGSTDSVPVSQGGNQAFYQILIVR